MSLRGNQEGVKICDKVTNKNNECIISNAHTGVELLDGIVLLQHKKQTVALTLTYYIYILLRLLILQ